MYAVQRLALVMDRDRIILKAKMFQRDIMLSNFKSRWVSMVPDTLSCCQAAQHSWCTGEWSLPAVCMDSAGTSADGVAAKSYFPALLSYIACSVRTRSMPAVAVCPASMLPTRQGLGNLDKLTLYRADQARLPASGRLASVHNQRSAVPLACNHSQNMVGMKCTEENAPPVAVSCLSRRDIRTGLGVLDPGCRRTCCILASDMEAIAKAGYQVGSLRISRQSTRLITIPSQ